MPPRSASLRLRVWPRPGGAAIDRTRAARPPTNWRPPRDPGAVVFLFAGLQMARQTAAARTVRRHHLRGLRGLRALAQRPRWACKRHRVSWHRVVSVERPRPTSPRFSVSCVNRIMTRSTGEQSIRRWRGTRAPSAAEAARERARTYGNPRRGGASFTALHPALSSRRRSVSSIPKRSLRGPSAISTARGATLEHAEVRDVGVCDRSVPEIVPFARRPARACRQPRWADVLLRRRTTSSSSPSTAVRQQLIHPGRLRRCASSLKAVDAHSRHRRQPASRPWAAPAG